MSNEHRNNLGENERPASLAAWLRAAADGELTPEQAREFAALRPELGGSPTSAADDAQRMEFERQLRSAVGRAMGSEQKAPSDLRAKIAAAMAAEPGHGFASEAPISISARRWNPGFGLAAAAVIALAIGAGIYYRGGGGAPEGSIITTAQASHLVSFISKQHDHCADFGAIFQRKMVARTEAEAASVAIELLSKVPGVLELDQSRLHEAGYEFSGLGRCQVPGEGRSAHLVYKSNAADSLPVSLFIQEDVGQMPLDCEHFYTCSKQVSEKVTLSVWKRDGFIYYLFTPDPAQQDRAREVFGAPSLRGRLS